MIRARQFGTLIGLVLLCAALWVLTPHFLTVSNLVNVVEQTSINAIVAVGMTFVIVSGGIDLSVGSIVALAGVVLGTALQGGQPFLLAFQTVELQLHAGLPRVGRWHEVINTDADVGQSRSFAGDEAVGRAGIAVEGDRAAVGVRDLDDLALLDPVDLRNAVRDALTGVFNREYFDHELRTQTERALLREGMGAWLLVRHSLIGRIGPSQ